MINMPSIPQALIPAAEELDRAGSILRKDASKEMDLLCKLGFAEVLKRLGPEPTPPKIIATKLAKDLCPGDYIIFDRKSHEVTDVTPAPCGSIPHPAKAAKALRHEQ